VHFQQHGSRCRMWIPPEIKDPILLHLPPRVWGISGPCACGMGALCSVWKPANSMGPASCSFFSNSVPPAPAADRLWSSPRIPVITTPACTDHGGTMPINLPWTSFPLTVPNSTRSSECGSSTPVVAGHNCYFDNLQGVIGAVESEFATWTTRNDILRRLCAIT
jgi:hypothetical protein